MHPARLGEETANPDFASEVARAARPLHQQAETWDVARQLARAAASAAANHRAAGRARSHVEFTARIGVALEESDEVVFWMEHLERLQTSAARSLSPLMPEARQLAAILGASVRTARRNRR